MLFIYDSNQTTKIALPVEKDKKFVLHKEDGYDTLTFEINSNDKNLPWIVEEALVEDDNNFYTIKSIDEHSDFITVDCKINLDDWSKEIFKDFVASEVDLEDILTLVLPTGWTLSGDISSYTKKHTVGKSGNIPWPACTAIEVFDRCTSLWEFNVFWNVKQKTLRIIDKNNFVSSGVYISEQLNLKSLGFTGTTKDFATRIYPYGKRDDNGENPITVASVNPTGEEYIDNNSYSDKIISVGWSDERYTNPQTLYDDAVARLAQMAVPARSYSCEVSTFTGDVYMFMVVTLLDIKRNLRVDHRVVEWKEYEDHTLDTVVLSMTSKTIESSIEKQNAQLDELSSKVDEATLYTSGYTIEFGELIGNSTFYFTRSYVDRPYFHWRCDDDSTPTITLLQRAGTYGAYIGATLSGVQPETATLLVFYCTLPTQEELVEE